MKVMFSLCTASHLFDSWLYTIKNVFCCSWSFYYTIPSNHDVHCLNAAELESLAANYTRQTELGFTTVFAGVVFEGLPTGNTTLTDATLKIRMNVTSVVDTTIVRQR